MDLLGDIVEKEVHAPVNAFKTGDETDTGFPKPKKTTSWSSNRSKSKFKQKQENEAKTPPKRSKHGFEIDGKTGLRRLPKDKQKLNYDNLSEAEKIHLENIEILNNMSEEDRLREKQELFDSFDPKVLKALLLRSEKKLLKKKPEGETPGFQGYGEWIGGDREGNDYETWKANTLDKDEVDEALNLKNVSLQDELARGSPATDLERVDSKKSVHFDEFTSVQYADNKEPEFEEEEGWEDVEEIAPPSYQINKEADEVPIEETIGNVHFLRPLPDNPDDIKIDINDPEFNEKLHEKYFPDLPKDTEKLKWMEPLPEIDTSELIFDDVSQLRFDFKGDLVIPSKNSQISTSQGLHHHAENPALAGYTLSELAHLARSSMSGQRCIAIRTLGRILHKLGKGKYNIVPEFVPEEGDNEQLDQQPDEEALKQASTKFDQMFWGVVDELRIIETLEESADESATPNLSVRNYAIEALWLWKQGGGNKRHAN